MSDLLMAFVAGLAAILLVLGVTMIAVSAYLARDTHRWKREAERNRRRAMQEWRDVRGRR